VVTGGDTRTHERIRAHYEIERELADRLRSAPASARPSLYAEVYDELFRRVPDHPQLGRRDSDEARDAGVIPELRLVRLFLPPGGRFLEIGAGDCSLAAAVAAIAEHVHAVDVSAEVAGGRPLPGNVELTLTHGCSLPVSSATIDLAYSNQLLEHLHPDDAAAHAAEVHRVLRPGGRYLCATPNRLTGPHDVSAGFCACARGLHLREYTTAELAALLTAGGFSAVRAVLRMRGRVRIVSALPLTRMERALERLGPSRAASVARRTPFRKLVGVVLADR
jgi:SAM-dependent methyltransferase